MSRLALLWCGLVIGVSFIATPAKFQADSLTLPVALDVGRSTFAWSHAVQLVLAAVALLGGGPDRLRLGRRMSTGAGRLMLVAIGALVVQQFVLLPLLDARVAAVIAGTPSSSSSPHLFYVGLEVLKVVVLGWAGLRTVRTPVRTMV
jgi:hypothetical protein